jgi:hypothetical protein
MALAENYPQLLETTTTIAEFMSAQVQSSLIRTGVLVGITLSFGFLSPNFVKKYLKKITSLLEMYGFTVLSCQKLSNAREIEPDYIIKVKNPDGVVRELFIDTPNLRNALSPSWKGSIKIGAVNTGEKFHKSFADFKNYLDETYTKKNSDYFAPKLNIDNP